MARYHTGFTIIETTLVLAITGLIIAVILFGIGNSLRHQRYNDAINQATDFFRGQYTNTTSVTNNRPEQESCNASGISTATPSTVGASDCLLLGRVIRSTDGAAITVNQVIALRDPTDDSGAGEMTDRDLLAASQLQQGNELETYQPEWGTRFQRPGSDDAASFTLLVVRTPVSGTIRTFSSTSGTVSISSLISDPAASQTDLRLCVDPSGFFGAGILPMGIAITKGAANTTGVQTIASGDCV